MALERDKVLIAAETLGQMVTAVGAAAATASGVAVLPAGLAKIAVDGMFKMLIRCFPAKPDLEKIVARIRDERTAWTIDTIKDAVITAAGMEPEYRTAIEELAEAASDPKGELDAERFRAAIAKMMQAFGESARLIPEIKQDTSALRLSQDQLLQGQADMKAELAEISQRLPGFQGVDKEQGPSTFADAGSSLSQPHHSYLVSRIDTLSSELRSVLDEKSKQKFDEINHALLEHSWPEVYALTADLVNWLAEHGDKLSPGAKGRALLTLADVAVIRDSGGPYSPRRGNTTHAWPYLRQAETAFGATPSQEDAERLIRIRAKLEFIDGKHDESILRLRDFTAPASISLRIAMFGELERWSEASDLALAQPVLDRKWCDDAIVAHVRAGRESAAEGALVWAKQQADPLTKQRCILAYCRERYRQLSVDGDSGAIVRLGEQDRQTIRHLNDELQDILRVVEAHGAPQSGLQAECLELAVLLGHAVNDHAACNAAASWLAKWKPVSFELARAVCRRDIGSLPDLPDRLLQDHGSLFQAKLLACILYSDCLGQPDKALDLIVSIPAESLDVDESQEAATSLLIAAQGCPEKRFDEVSGVVARLVGDGHRIACMLRAVVFSRKGELARAAEELVKAEDNDDYLWLELAGSLAMAQSQWQHAAERFNRAAVLTGNSEAFLAEAMAWYKAGDIVRTIAPLEIAARLDPSRRSTLHNLAAAYQYAGRHEAAAQTFEVLHRRYPDDAELALRYASALAIVGKASEALGVLDGECSRENVPVQPVLMRAHYLFALDRPKAALDSLKPFRERFSQDHRFLLAVLQLGYAAEEEECSNDAFAKLAAIEARGELPKGVLEKHTVEELPEMMRSWRGRQEQINQEHLRGRLPWMVASRWAQSSSFTYRDWLIRTQDMVVADHPDALAEYSTYATNGFTVGEFQEHRWLVELRAPADDARVVVDMTALISLHRLGLLNALAQCFRRIILPASYRLHWLDEQGHIPHHQPEQIRARQAIIDAVSNGRLRVEHSSPAQPGYVLDEYETQAAEGNRPIRMRQIAQWLRSQGRLGEDDWQRLGQAQHQPSVVPDAEAEAALAQGKLPATAFTLQTLHHLRLLDAFLSAMPFSLPGDDYHAVERELLGMRAIEKAGSWHHELIAAVRELPRVEFVGLKNKPDNDEHPEVHYAIDATLLAIQEDCPLLADDRYCQQGRLAASPLQSDRAFGTDVLLEHMAARKLISPDEHARVWLKLMRWRYKFLLPPVSVLLTVANRFKNGLPGGELQEIAVYMHDCMRDLGLYGGRENTDPPMPMAVKLFNAWTDRVVDFCFTIWWDVRFSEEQATAFVRWVLTSCRPSIPRNVGIMATRVLSGLTAEALLGALMQRCLTAADVRKVHKLVKQFRKCLGLGAEQFAGIFERISRPIASGTAPFGESAVRALYARLLRAFFGPRRQISWRLLPEAEALGLITSVGQLAPHEAALLEVLTDRNSPKRLRPKTGPFAFIAEEDKASGLYLPDILAARHPALRQAALQDIAPDAHCPKCPAAHAVIDEQGTYIARGAAREWVPAGVLITEALNDDLLLNIAGFEQSRRGNYEGGCGKCWQRVINPSAEGLLSIPHDGWGLLNDTTSAAQTFSMMRQAAASVEGFLVEYERLVGHLCLCSPFDLGTQLRTFLQGRTISAGDWNALRTWCYDPARPWRRYHACQALLRNSQYLPVDEAPAFAACVAEVACLMSSEAAESDAAQVWRLHADLAAHYLRILELSGIPLDGQRPLTVAWWSAKRVMEMLLEGVLPDSIPAQVREWRKEPIINGTALVHDSWAWLRPEAASPTRCVVMRSHLPLSIAILVALGDNAVTFRELGGLPEQIAGICNAYFIAAVGGHAESPSSAEPPVWVWDKGLMAAATAFVDSWPSEEHGVPMSQLAGFLRTFGSPDSLTEAFEKLPASTEAEAIMLASRIRAACNTDPGIAETILKKLRDDQWRTQCLQRLPVLAWEIMAHGLFALQARHGLQWHVEMPYVWLRGAEANAGDAVRSRAFLVLLLMSSLSGATAGAIKSLMRSSRLPDLRAVLLEIRSGLRALRDAGGSLAAGRFREVCAVLDPL